MILASVFGIILAAAPAATAKTDCSRDELIGPVHTVVATFQSLKKQDDGSIDTTQTPAWSDTYDPLCKLVEHKQFSVDFIDVQSPHRIDATTLVIHSNMGDKTVRERFDAGGNRVEVWTTMSTSRSFLDHNAYVYDANGRVVRINSFDENGKPYGDTRYTRDASGNIVREDLDFGDGRTLVETYTYEFDARGNWTKEFESGNDPDNPAQNIVPTGIITRTITYYRQDP